MGEDGDSVMDEKLESFSPGEFLFGTLVGRKKFYRAGVASSGGGLKFLVPMIIGIGYFLFQDKK